MAASRLDQLSEILKQSPGNLLARYGLAVEYAQLGDHENALANLRALMASNPDYVAAYYQAGRVLQKVGDKGQAREVFEQGILACNRVGDQHAKSEMEAALGELMN